jgi:hypothetical protein
MKGTRRAIGIGTVVLLAALGTGVALEKPSSHFGTPGAATVPASPKATDIMVAPVSSTPPPTQAGAVSDSSEEYDRSDLLLSQG